MTSRKIIGAFPHPFTDEVLYSVFARYQAKMGFSGRLTVSRMLVGKPEGSDVMDLPSRIGYLITHLPPGRLSKDEVIDNHTLLPLYAPFRDPAVVYEVREIMTNYGRVHAKLGIAQSRMLQARPFRYCPIHAAVDRITPLVEQAYWRRVHQAPGVLVCPEHCVFLESYDGSALNPRDRYVSAEEGIPDPVPVGRPVDPGDPNGATLLALAQGADLLLQRPAQGIDQNTLTSRYQALLEQRGYLTPAGGVRYTRLRAAFRAMYPDELLDLLGCPLLTYEDWLGRLLRGQYAARGHPIHHLLLLRFLKVNVADFIDFSPQSPLPTGKSKPFGDGPYPCLNPVAEHRGDPTIAAYTIRKQEDRRKPITATFACPDCGYTYVRYGPEKSPEERWKGQPVEFGPEWEREFRRLWRRTKVSLLSIATRMGLGHWTGAAVHHAIRIGLNLSRRPRAMAHTCHSCPRASDAARERKQRDQIRRDRTAWLKLVRTHPGVPVSRLKLLTRRARSAWRRLEQQDREWLRAHSPHASYVPTGRIVDWAERDRMIEALVREAAARIRDIDPPRRITKRALVRQIRSDGASASRAHVRCIEKTANLSLLPLTSAALDEVLETVEDLQARRNAPVHEALRNARKDALRRRALFQERLKGA